MSRKERIETDGDTFRKRRPREEALPVAAPAERCRAVEHDHTY